MSAKITTKTLIDAFPYIIQIPTSVEYLLYAGTQPNFYIERKHKGIYQSNDALQNLIREEERMHSSTSALQKLAFEAVRLIQIAQYNK